MTEGFFVNKIYRIIFDRLENLLKMAVFIGLILLFVTLISLVEESMEVRRLSVLDNKISSTIEKAMEENFVENNRELESFLGKVDKVKRAAEFDGMEPIEWLNILEKTIPDVIRVQSLEYQAGKGEYRINAITGKKESISNFLERLEKELFSEVMLIGQQKSANQYLFTVVIMVK